MRRLRSFIGPPGCGKTETLLREVRRIISEDGVSPDRVGYISFTRAAVQVAIDRVGKTQEELPYFRTIHSMCFRLCGVSTTSVMQRGHYQELGDALGVDLTGNLHKRATIEELCDGDKALAIIELARTTKTTVPEVLAHLDYAPDFLLIDLVDRALIEYKKTNNLIDYTGMLERYLQDGSAPDISVLIVDEAQDLSVLQWDVVERLSRNCSEVILAGDDDQLIYDWAGARVDRFKAAIDNSEKTILGQSWRVPQTVHALAEKVSGEIVFRISKTYLPRPASGEVSYCASLEDIDMSGGEWLVLVRNRYMVAPIVEHCRREGYFYSCFLDSPDKWDSLRLAIAWENLRKGKQLDRGTICEMLELMDSVIPMYDRISFSLFSTKSQKDLLTFAMIKEAVSLKEGRPWFEALQKIPIDEREYLRSALRRGEHVRQVPRITIDTIHGAKGSERDNVVLFTDVSYRTFQGMDRDPDAERRVFYVGITRAKEKLYIIQPSTPYFFNLEL